MRCAVQARRQLAAQHLVECEAQVAHACHRLGVLRRALQPRHQLEGVAEPRGCGRCPRAAGAGWHNPGWPSSGRGSCSRRASRRCRARTPPAAPAGRRLAASGRYRRTGTLAARARVQPVVVERAVGRRWPSAARDRRAACWRVPHGQARARPGAAAQAQGQRRAEGGSGASQGVLQCRSAGPGAAAPAAAGWRALAVQQPLIFSTASST